MFSTIVTPSTKNNDISQVFCRTLDDPCWLWIGPLRQDGYGCIRLHHRQWRAHRLIYRNFVGDIPKGLDVLHRCDVRNCVNPAHLFLGNDKDNHQDKAAKGRHWQQKKTHCPKGHAYTPENTYIPPSGGRHCCICKGMPPRTISTKAVHP